MKKAILMFLWVKAFHYFVDDYETFERIGAIIIGAIFLLACIISYVVWRVRGGNQKNGGDENGEGK